MDKIKNYEFFARLEVERKALLIPRHDGTQQSILKMLDHTVEIMASLDRELIELSREYIKNNTLTDEEAEYIYEINAASLAALMVKADVPGFF